MDDKFLRDKINDDNIEIPESLLPENISKLLEKSEEKVNGLVESDMDGRAEGTNENIVDTKSINEKAVNESDKKNREKRQMIKYLRSCALAAAALIVVLAGASMMGRLRENKYTAAVKPEIRCREPICRRQWRRHLYAGQHRRQGIQI